MTKTKRDRLKAKAKEAILSGKARDAYKLWMILGQEELSRATANTLFNEIMDEIVESDDSTPSN